MSIVDELRSLDTSDPGRWPLPIRVGAVAVVFTAAVAFGIYMFVIESEMPLLRDAEQRGSRPCVGSSRIGSGKPPTSTPTALSSTKSSVTSARCCGSCRARRKSRTC